VSFGVDFAIADDATFGFGSRGAKQMCYCVYLGMRTVLIKME